MKTIDHYLSNKCGKGYTKKIKPISVPLPSVVNKHNNDDEIFINFPQEDGVKDNYPVKKVSLIKKDKVVERPVVLNPQQQVDLIKRKKRYNESSGVVMKCSECGVLNSYAKKTSNNDDVTNVQCSNCFREINLRGYLSFSDHKFYQRTEENASWFDENIRELLISEKPRIIKF